MNTIKLFILLLVVALVANAQDVTKTISNLKNKYAPDKRVAIFDISAAKKDNIIELKGETNCKKAVDELLDSLTKEKVKFVNSIDILPSEKLKGKIHAVVTLSCVNGRGKGAHSAEMITQALLGTPLNVIKANEDEDWYMVQTPDNYLCWVDDDAIQLMDDKEFEDWRNAAKVIFTKEYGHCYEAASNKSDYVSDLVAGNILKSLGEENGYTKVEFPDKRVAYINNNECLEINKWYNSLNVNADNLINTGKRFLGQPYLWGGTSAKALDCSGFVKTTFYLNGVVLQRDASQQALYGQSVEVKDVAVDFKNLQPGDLLFWGRKADGNKTEKVTHVGLYIGKGEYIHCSGRVKRNSFDKNAKNYHARLVKAFIKAKRYINSIDTEGIQSLSKNQYYKGYFNAK